MAAAIATAFTASPTMAASYSSASLSNFQVSLVDLDLNDGITPSITFQPNYHSFFRISARPFGADSSEFFSLDGDDISPLSKTITHISNNVSASISGDNFANRVFQASGNSSGEEIFGISSQGYVARIADRFSYILSANTQLNITAKALNYMETTATAADVAASRYEYAASSASLFITGSNNINFTSDLDQKGLISYFYQSMTPINLNELTLLSLTLDNIGEQKLAGVISSSIGVDGTSYTGFVDPNLSAIPVPAALPLMASAVGLFGLGAKRRKALKA